MTKRKNIKNAPKKTKNELTKKDGKKEVLATYEDSDGKEVNIERWHIKSVNFSPTPMVSMRKLSKENLLSFTLKLMAVKMALKSESKDLQNEAINEILGDLIEGAYQDKVIAYNRALTENCEGSSKAFRELQKIRQAADIHLLNIIKTIRDIKRPPVNAIVRRAEQVNIAEQINQGDKQVNIAKNQCSNNTQNP